jgi:hypothetical protein
VLPSLHESRVVGEDKLHRGSCEVVLVAGGAAGRRPIDKFTTIGDLQYRLLICKTGFAAMEELLWSVEVHVCQEITSVAKRLLQCRPSEGANGLGESSLQARLVDRLAARFELEALHHGTDSHQVQIAISASPAITHTSSYQTCDVVVPSHTPICLDQQNFRSSHCTPYLLRVLDVVAAGRALGLLDHLLNKVEFVTG